MNIKTALKNVIGFPLPEDTLDKVLIDASLTGSDDYSVANKRAIDLCAIELFLFLLTSADIKDLDFARTLPSEGKLKTAYRILTSKCEVPNLIDDQLAPTVEGRSPW